MYYTHCMKQGPHSIIHITILIYSCTQQHIISRLEEEGENRRENVRIREREREKQRESKAESIVYLNHSVS